MSVSKALRESYASGDTASVLIETCELDHASANGPLYLVRAVDTEFGNPGDTIGLPLVQGGPKVPHLICAFDAVPPGADTDGPTEGKLRFDNVSDVLSDLLDDVVGYNQPIYVNFRFYNVVPGQLAAVTGPDDDTFMGLIMDAVEVNADTAEGTFGWPDGRQQNVPTGPNAFFNRDSYPALFT